MNKRYKELDLVKGIGILFVCLGHTFNISGLEWDNVVTYLYRTTYSFHMPLFFFISGFLSNNDRNIELKKFYIGKLKRLAVPYFFINLIDFFPRTLFPNLVNSEFEGIEKVIFYGTKISWFVYTLFIIFIIFPFLDKWILKKDKYYLFGILLIGLNYFKLFENIKLFSLETIITYLPYFYFGYMIKPFYEKKIVNGIWSRDITFIGTTIIFLGFSYKYFYLNIFNSIIFALLGMLFVLNISLRLKENSIIYNFLKFCGINSLTFYLMEGFITVVYRVILIRIIPIEHYYLLTGIFFILRVATAYILVKFIVVKSTVLSFLLGASVEKIIKL